MNTRRLISTTFVVTAFAVSCVARITCFGQESPTTPISVVVTSASGAERPLPGSDYMLGRAGLGPEQSVTVTLQLPRQAAGLKISVSSLDGGEVSAVEEGTSDLYVSEDGTAPFQFRGGQTPGLYRLRVQFASDIYWLEFYVLNLEHPEKNPPRVRIVN